MNLTGENVPHLDPEKPTDAIVAFPARRDGGFALLTPWKLEAVVDDESMAQNGDTTDVNLHITRDAAYQLVHDLLDALHADEDSFDEPAGFLEVTLGVQYIRVIEESDASVLWDEAGSP